MEVCPFLGSLRGEVMFDVFLLCFTTAQGHRAHGCEQACQSPPELGNVVSEASLSGCLMVRCPSERVHC